MLETAVKQRPYESLFIVPVDVPQKKVDAFLEKLKSTLVSAGAEVRGIQIWGRRRLTYPIKHHRDGLYVYVDYNGSRETPEILKNLYRVTDIVLRFLTTARVEYLPPRTRRAPGESPEGAPAKAADKPAEKPAETSPSPNPPSKSKEE